MTNEQKIFLEKVDEMIAAAKKIEGMNFDFGITVASSNDIIEERRNLINHVNSIYAKHGYSYTSTENAQ